jgi:hypothetical protein
MLSSVAPLLLDKCYADFRDHLCHDVFVVCSKLNGLAHLIIIVYVLRVNGC